MQPLQAIRRIRFDDVEDAEHDECEDCADPSDWIEKQSDEHAHHFVNRSDKPARMLVFGTRLPGDACFYPDDDLMWVETEQGGHAAHKDGTRY